MNVTSEQLEALRHGEPVPVDIEQEKCVLILQETYEVMKQLLDDLRLMYPVVLQAWEADGSPEDGQLYME